MKFVFSTEFSIRMVTTSDDWAEMAPSLGTLLYINIRGIMQEPPDILAAVIKRKYRKHHFCVLWRYVDISVNFIV